MEKKITTSLICRGSPNEFSIFPNHSMPYESTTSQTTPIYPIPRSLHLCEGYQYDYVFDWSVQHGVQDEVASGFGVPFVRLFGTECDYNAICWALLSGIYR